MKRLGMKGLMLSAVVLVGTAALLLVYWHGAVRAGRGQTDADHAHARVVAYYQHPDGLPDYSPGPRKDDKGRDYVPVYEDQEPGAAPAGTKEAGTKASPAERPRKVLYYRNPMGLADVSPVPKKDPMGMDYIPVYEGDAGGSDRSVQVSAGRAQLLGVRTEEVRARPLVRSVRAVGTIQPNERTQSVVAPKFEGWIERLHVNATGMTVKRGDPLMEVYAPEVSQAIQEYLAVQEQAGQQGTVGDTTMARLAEAALRRLQNLDLAAEDIRAMGRDGIAPRTVTLRAPMDGIVIEKKAVQGMRFMAGEMLYQIADLTTVWVLAEVFESDLPAVRLDQRAVVTTTAGAGAPRKGRVAFIYPVVAPETRTVRVRIEIPNPDLGLKPGMFATVQMDSSLGAGPLLAVPDSAVLDSGVRQAVLVETAPGRFAPRAVTLGIEAEGYREVRSGLAAGERVVVSANFLIDSESNLKAAFLSFAATGAEGGAGAR